MFIFFPKFCILPIYYLEDMTMSGDVIVKSNHVKVLIFFLCMYFFFYRLIKKNSHMQFYFDVSCFMPYKERHKSKHFLHFEFTFKLVQSWCQQTSLMEIMYMLGLETLNGL